MSIFLKIAKFLNDVPHLSLIIINNQNNDEGEADLQYTWSNYKKKPKIGDTDQEQWILTKDLYLEYQNLIKDDYNNSTQSDIKKLLNAHMLEKKMLALDLDLYLAYIYVSLTKKLFSCKFISNNITVELINSVDIDNIIDTKIKRKLAIIHSTFEYKNNYFVYIDDTLALPWNDFILPTLARSLLNDNLINNLKLPDMSYNVKDNNLMVSMEDYKSELYSIGNAIYKNIPAILTDQLFGEIVNNNRLENFLTKTNSVAVSVNGTACSYKSTFINNCLTAVKGEIDSNARIFKIGKMGRFRGKDSNQVLAMNYQYMTSSLVQLYYTSLFDRCKFNNMIWRIILACLDSTKNPVQVVLKRFMDFTPYLINQMKMEPIIIFIDLDKVGNRKRMYNRNLGNDRARSLIELYVSAQNIVYGMLAYLCDWPIFSADVNLHPKITELVINKIKANVSACGGKLPPQCKIPDHKLIPSKNVDTDNTYDHSKYLNVFK